MKSNKIVAVFITALTLVAGSPVMAASVDPMAAHSQSDVLAKQERIANYRAGAQYQEYTGAQRKEASIREVMRLNGITHEAAEARYMAAIISQSGAVGVSPLFPSQVLAFNPMYQAWMDLGGSFFAGVDSAGRYRTTVSQLVKVRMDNFWYCPAGQSLVFDGTTSSCQ